jgi:hypothetical protein
MNLYHPRDPIYTAELFIGRIYELNDIAAFLRGSQSISIIGPRAIGKTSLLFHLMRPMTWSELGLEPNNLFVYLDCETLRSSTASDVFGRFAAGMAEALDSRSLAPEPALATAVAQPTRLAFEIAVRKLNQRGLQVVLLLDNFERLTTNEQLDVNFYTALRSVAGRYQFVFLTASTDPLIELTYSEHSQEILSSPFFNIFASIFLGLLSEDEARRLIREPAQNAGTPFSPSIEVFIYTLVGGHPLALQVACCHAFNLGDDHAEIERLTMRELRAYFQYIWDDLTTAEQEMLRCVSKGVAQDCNDTNIRKLLRDLVQKCLLVADGLSYRSPSRAWAQFIAARHNGKVCIESLW